LLFSLLDGRCDFQIYWTFSNVEIESFQNGKDW